VGPATFATRAVASEPDTESTRVVSPITAPHEAVPAAARARQPRPPRHDIAAAPTPTSYPAAKRGRAGRTLLLLFLFAVLAAGGAAAVIVTSADRNAVQLRQVVQNDVNRTIDSMRQLVEDNTQ
jgi:hypothetical protein